jgi:PAS domain S-box-containing protein
MPSIGHNYAARAPVLIAVVAAVHAIIVGTSALLGWLLDIPRLTDWTSQGISMFVNAALCAMLSGIALLLLVSSRGSRAIVASRLLAGAVMLIAALTLFEHVTGVNLGIDTLVVNRPWGQIAATAPMRMGVPASTSFFILGAALVLVPFGDRWRAAASVLALVTAGIASLSLTGYWFGASQLFGVARITGIALLTTTVVAALSIGVIASSPEHGLTAALRRKDAGGSVFRRLIVPVLAVPLVLGWLRILGQSAGLYDLEFGTALRSLAEIALLFGLLWWTANNISWHASSAEQAYARLAAIIESSDDAIIGMSLNGTIESWNAGAQRVFGYSAEEVIGHHVALIIPKDRLNEEARILSRIRVGERVEHFETKRVRKDGVQIDISLTVSPIKNANGQIIGASKISRDITDRRRTEERLRAIVEATPECVKIVGPDGSLEFINQAGMSMIECDSEPAVRGACVYDLIAHEHRDDWIARHAQICAGERMHWQFEIVGLKGARRWMEAHAVPLSLPDGRVAQLAVTRDITERMAMEREREQLLESERAARNEAERASHLKDEFLATLSHELRTPLNAILGWSQLLHADSDPADLKEGLDAIQRNARTQTQLIEDLLDMSRIISGKVRIDVQSTDLATVIEAAVQSVSPAAEAKGIRVRKVLDAKGDVVSGDPTRLQQVVWNLLSNAIKFTPKGGSVDVILKRVNSHLQIIVHDSGIGIAAEHLPVIFERFRQADSSTTRAHGGLGLGLSIVKQLVELHGGTVRAESPGVGAGATFTVTLPLSPIRGDESGEQFWKAPSAEFVGHQVNLAGVRVLIVDDEPDTRALVARVLTQCGAEVCGAASAAGGLQQLADFKPHVLVSDIGMPETDGYAFMRTVRNRSASEGGGTPAIALTAFARSEDRTRAMLAGYQVHIAKPIEPQELAVTVQTLSRRLGASTLA